MQQLTCADMNRGAARHIWDVPLATFLKEVSVRTNICTVAGITLTDVVVELDPGYYSTTNAACH